MVSVEVLAVGRELLIGKTLNTNSHWVGGRLARMGGMARRMVTVTDALDEISSALKGALARRPDFLVVIGGLGPTPDDMTLEGVALALGRTLRSDKQALALMAEHYRQMRGKRTTVTPARRKMSLLPSGSSPISNPVGTAPAVRLVEGGSVIFCLPGVPREMKAIFAESVEPEIRMKLGRIYSKSVTFHLRGVFESTLAPHIAAAMEKYPGAYVKSHPKGLREGVSHIELHMVTSSRSKAEAEEEAESLASYMERRIAKAGGSIARTRREMLG